MKTKLKKTLILISFLILITSPLFASSGGAEESLTEKMTELVFEIGVILFAARLGGSLMKKLKMPSVLGELLIGIVIGPYLLGGLPFLGFHNGLFPLGEGLSVSPELYGIATIASIILLFLSGLETDLALFLQFSIKGAIIGITGVVVSFLSGAWAGSLITGAPLFNSVNLFMGVLSIATSVGITARILSEQRKMDSPEGVTILAAAVIDDVLGIILLAIVLGIVSVLSGGTGSGVDWGAIGVIALKAIGVWLGFTVVGLYFARKISDSLKIFRSETTIAIMSLGLALLLSGIFEKAGLAMIIGAYVMGLSLSRTDLSFVIQEKLHPLEEFFVPIFFCVMGMLVNVNEFLDPRVLMGGLLFSVLGILAKIIGCGAPSLFLNFNMHGALRIGVGMVPRGEVALIIAGIGIANGILNDSLFGVAIFMTLTTTLIPPPLLTALLKNGKMGTRTEMKGSNTVSTVFDFPTREMTQMVLTRVISSLKEEGFYVHELDVDDHVVSQVRKDDVFLTFHEYEKSIEIVSDAVDVHYVKTVMYESLLGMNNIINKIKDMAKPEVLKEGLKDLSNDQKSRVQENYFRNLNEECISLDLKGRNKDAILEEMVGMMNSAGLLDDYEAGLKAVKEREESMSTGMQNGIAIPHGKSDSVKELVVAIGFKKEGIDFQSLDGMDSKIFIMTLSPRNTMGPHIQFLSSVSAILNKSGISEELMTGQSPAEVKAILIREAHESP